MNATFTEVVPDHPFKWVDGKPPYFEFTSQVTRIHAGDTVEVPIRLDARDSRYERLKQLYDRCLYFEGRCTTLERELEQLRDSNRTETLEETQRQPKHTRKGQ